MQEKAKEPEIRFAGFTGAWEQRKAKDVLAAYSDKGHPGLDVLSATQDRGMVRRDDNNINISHDKKNEATYKRVLPGQFVIHLRSFQGGFAYSSIEGITSPAYTVFGFSKPQEHEPNFWKFVFSSEQFIKRLEKVTYGIRDGRSISYDEVLTLSFTFPGKEEQIQIAHFLDKVGALITLHQRKYEKLLNIKKSMLEKMFPKEGEVVPEIRFKGFTGAWEQRKFGEMANRRSEVSASGNLPRVEYEDIVSGTGTLNKDVFEKQSQKQGIVFHSGDVLYGKLRPYLQNWLLASFNGLAVGDFWVLEPQGLNSNYLYRIIQTKQFDEIANQSVGTKMPRADWKLVSKATFLNPASFNEQRLIGKFFKDIDSLLTLHQRKLEMLKNVKQAFLEKMFV